MLAIGTEALLVVLVFLVVGRLTAQPPARDVLTQNAERVAIPLVADGQEATLYITPGTVGPNHYRFELGSGHNHSIGRGGPPVEAVLRVELPSRDTGQKQIDLTQASGDAFEAHGSELSIAGDWTIEALVRQAGQADWRVSTTLPISVTGPQVDIPPPPPRFGPGGVLGLLLAVIGIIGLLVARHTRRRASEGSWRPQLDRYGPRGHRAAAGAGRARRRATPQITRGHPAAGSALVSAWSSALRRQLPDLPWRGRPQGRPECGRAQSGADGPDHRRTRWSTLTKTSPTGLRTASRAARCQHSEISSITMKSKRSSPTSGPSRRAPRLPRPPTHGSKHDERAGDASRTGQCQ